jgi:hypothetical protein
MHLFGYFFLRNSEFSSTRNLSCCISYLNDRNGGIEGKPGRYSNRGNKLCVRMTSVVWWSELLATNPEVRVRFPALPDFVRSNGTGTGST